MTNAEVTAYLAGVDIAHTAEVVRVDTIQVLPPDLGPENGPLAMAFRSLGPEKFKHWVLRGVGDAFKAGHDLP